MSMSDPIADMLTRIRNAQAVDKEEINLPSSKIKVAIAKLLLDEGYIDAYREEGDVKKTLNIKLKYYAGRPVIEYIKRISKPGLRVYTAHDNISRVMNGLGIAIVSTSKGLMTDSKARTLRMGGEIICHVA